MASKLVELTVGIAIVTVATAWCAFLIWGVVQMFN